MTSLRALVRSNDSLYNIAKIGRDISLFPAGWPLKLPRMAMISKIYSRTMLNPTRLFNICDAVEQARDRGIAGDLVECGVWSGGSLALMALWDLRQGGNRNYHAFDSFEGLPPPTEEDNEVYARFLANRGKAGAAVAGQLVATGVCKGDGADTVRQFFDRVGIPRDRSVFHVGWFQDTVPLAAKDIGTIAILRIDGDWYNSTKVCLEHLYDLVSPGGLVIVDDYGAFSGCRKAVDEFRMERDIGSPIVPIDDECIMFEKPQSPAPIEVQQVFRQSA